MKVRITFDWFDDDGNPLKGYIYRLILNAPLSPENMNLNDKDQLNYHLERAIVKIKHDRLFREQFGDHDGWDIKNTLTNDELEYLVKKMEFPLEKLPEYLRQLDMEDLIPHIPTLIGSTTALQYPVPVGKQAHPNQ